MDWLLKKIALEYPIPPKKARRLLCYFLIGLLLMVLLSGKSNLEIKSIAVSQNEEFVACFSNIDGCNIRCFSTDGLLQFHYDIPLDISSGGNCALWFDGDILYARFYRSDLIVSFDMDGTVTDICHEIATTVTSEYPSFLQQGHRYVFEGQNLGIVYDTGGLGYWLWGEKRYLKIAPLGEEPIVLMSWVARNP